MHVSNDHDGDGEGEFDIVHGIVSEWSIPLILGMYRSGPWAGAGGGPMSGEAELNNHWRLLTH